MRKKLPAGSVKTVKKVRGTKLKQAKPGSKAAKGAVKKMGAMGDAMRKRSGK